MVYLKMMKKGLYSLLLLSLLISDIENWYTNPLDYVFSRTTNRMTFRESILFSPFDFKFGMFSYGGSDYWSQGFGKNTLGISPVLLDSSNFQYNGLEKTVSRSCYLIELDMFKINLPNYVYKQNYVDFQFGLGYKMMGLIENPGIDLPVDFLENSNTDPTGNDRGEYKYRPFIQDYNINTTINWQMYDFVLAYLYHSIGLSDVSLYQSEGGDRYLYGQGIGESFGIGFKGLLRSRYDRKDYRVSYGFEAKWISTIVDEFNDPYKISPINGFDMRGMGWNINFGIVFGGERSIGDQAYQSMIKDDFISAVDEFEEFIDDNPRHIKKLKAQKMLEFCKKQKPYQEFQNGINAYNDRDYDQAASWYESALRTADNNLAFEITVKQKELSTLFLDSALNNLEILGFNKSESLVRKAKSITDEIEEKANKYLAEIYLLKGDVFYNIKDYETALKNYENAYSYDSRIRSIYINKVKEVSSAIIDQSNDAKNKGDILFALSSLKKLIKLNPSLENNFTFGIRSLQKKLDDLSSNKTQDYVEGFIEGEKNRAKKRIFQKVKIGMSKEKVVELLGQPAFVEDKYIDNDIKELWFYFDELEEKYISFYFENNLMIRVDQ
tara:strand:- start:5434 stop:7260 length:1827 start_codon:yes stop_codon:yes gene_type:complete